ncbi:unnamed protein product [Didymodactylos carnosus]|uniref:Uncharacterized protein n=1 Tax=Didymodactylos carnosus TaxID=1234261 RepID=A0A814USR1_9BILA|nr:unnamed protein product [Didymodactylos carnosus]CAF3943288.1 unnamed protein product [Didymodactylos carnosus]
MENQTEDIAPPSPPTNYQTPNLDLLPDHNFLVTPTDQPFAMISNPTSQGELLNEHDLTLTDPDPLPTPNPSHPPTTEFTVRPRTTTATVLTEIPAFQDFLQRKQEKRPLNTSTESDTNLPLEHPTPPAPGTAASKIIILDKPLTPARKKHRLFADFPVVTANTATKKTPLPPSPKTQRPSDITSNAEYPELLSPHHIPNPQHPGLPPRINTPTAPIPRYTALPPRNPHPQPLHQDHYPSYCATRYRARDVREHPAADGQNNIIVYDPPRRLTTRKPSRTHTRPQPYNNIPPLSANTTTSRNYRPTPLPPRRPGTTYTPLMSIRLPQSASPTLMAIQLPQHFPPYNLSDHPYRPYYQTTRPPHRHPYPDTSIPRGTTQRIIPVADPASTPSNAAPTPANKPKARRKRKKNTAAQPVLHTSTATQTDKAPDLLDLFSNPTTCDFPSSAVDMNLALIIFH